MSAIVKRATISVQNSLFGLRDALTRKIEEGEISAAAEIVSVEFDDQASFIGAAAFGELHITLEWPA